ETSALITPSRSLLPRAPPQTLCNNGPSRASELSSVLPVVEPFGAGTATARGGENLAMTFQELLARCTAMLGVPAGVEAEESLRRVLKAWSEGSTTFDCGRNAQGLREASRPRRSKQRPLLPVEARGRTRVGGSPDGQIVTENGPLLLAVRGSHVDSSVNKDRQLAMAEAAAARWEKRYHQQITVTEKALLEKRNANISLREAERVLEKERAAAAKAAQKANFAAAEAAEALREVVKAQDETKGGLEGALSESAEQSLQSMAIRERCENQLRQRLQASEDKLVTADTERKKLREALKAAETNRSLQPVVVALGEILRESLASLGLVRSVPEAKFHAIVSVLRDRAEKAARGYLSVEGLHAAAEGARALDAMSNVRAQVRARALLDASRQRARRVSADARLKEREAGEMERAFGKDDLIKARNEVENTRARLCAVNAELQQLKKCLKDEQERSAAARRAASLNRSAPIADVRGIFDEGHRMVQAKMKLKAQQIQQEVVQMQEDLSGARKWC
ncbi:unnamed protein product, partial [Pylaiella littoralis]